MANNNWAQLLFDEPMATQGFRTTGNDPLNQFASWYQFGQNLRQGADARRARRDAEDMARNEANGNRGNNPQAAIGVDANGVYGVNGSPAQPSGGIGVDASGVYGVNGTQQPSFNGNGGFDWSKVSPMPNGDSAMNAWGNNSNSMFSGMGNKESDNNMNITSQRIGQNYNNRIDGQVGGLNIPQSPQGNSWGQALGNAENNSFSNFTGGSLANFQNPASSVDQAQVAGGATNLSADNPFARSSKYLSDQYDKMAYVKQALDNGVKNPLVAMQMYDQMIAPLRESAKEDELRNAFFVLQNPESSDQDKMNAVSLIQYYKKDPYMQENQQMKRDKAMYDMGYLPEGDFGYGDTNGGGSDFVNKVRDLQGKIGYRAPDGTNCMRTLGIALQGTPYEGQINVDQAVNTAKEHGDLHVSGDGYTPRAGDIAVVNDGNHAVMLTERGGTIQNGSSHDGVYEDPRSPEEMFGGVKYWISSSRYGKGRQGYRRDPYRVSQREKFDYAKKQDAMNYALRNRAIDARLAAKTGNVNSNFEKNNVGVREAAMNLAGLQNVSPDDEKGIQNYEKGMKDFTKQIGALYDAYGLNGNKMDSTQLGIALYHKLNETRSGLRPETLAEGVARAIYLKRGDVGAEDLQRAILAEVYGDNEQQNGTQNTTAKSPKDRTLQVADERRLDREIGDLDDNSEGALVTSDGRKFTDSQLKARDMFLKERHINPTYKRGKSWWDGVFSI